MTRIIRNTIIAAVLIVSVFSFTVPSGASGYLFLHKEFVTPPDSTLPVKSGDTTKKSDGPLPFPFKDTDEYPFSGTKKSPLYGKDPDNLKSDTDYDPTSNDYQFNQRIGSFNYRTPKTMSFKDYKNYNFENGMRDYWKQKAKSESFSNRTSLIPQLHVGGETFDRIFGGNTIDIKPQGSAEVIFGININKVDNPTLPERLRRTTTFDFKEKIQMNVQGKIGEKLKLSVVYNTEATFDFENSIKIEYTGFDDEIIQKIEAGNVSLPLGGSLITGSQSLFGIKTELKFGKLNVTTVFSQQKGQTSTIEVKGGAQTTNYEVTSDNYEANKHFFLSHYFQKTYNQALSALPILRTNINITRVEVWVTNKSSNFNDSRNIVALMDLGEMDNLQSAQVAPYNLTDQIPYDTINNLKSILNFSNLRSIDQVTFYMGSKNFFGGTDFEKLENARKLSETEYTLNSKLGFISLNSALNSDEILAVAFEYTANGKTYRVGEFSNGGIAAPNALVVKLLKGTSLTPRLKNWSLMMKNIYSIGAYQVSNDNFWLDILYDNPQTGVSLNYIPDGKINRKPLLEVLSLDNLNAQLDPSPDGMFDFIEKVTINSSNGRIIFPVLEPFGRDLRSRITGGDGALDAIANRYVYEELYDSTQSKARQIAEKNKFKLKGSYKSSVSSEIPLNAINIPQGSVKVTANGRPLTENTDFTVNYTLGRVKIINQGLLESGTPIQISMENNSLFSIQSKSLLGARFNYDVNKNLTFGGTVLNLTERPLTQKVNIGDEPISNTIWGIDGTYKTDVPIITKLIDKLPFIDTKEKSTLLVAGEFAHLIPGHSSAIDEKGTSYIDDFEGSKTSMDIKSFNAWSISSTPQGQPALFPEGLLTDSARILANGFNRAKLSWYSIDPLFLRNNAQTPSHIKNDKNTQSSHYVREIFEQEIFPFKEPQNGIPSNMSVLNLAYYPDEKGPYNFDAVPMPGLSYGIDLNGKLLSPEKRWGGIMRKIDQSDFESANFEHIEFWVMDPFVEDPTNAGGELYFNLGNISEDILKDSRKAFENGLPTGDEVKNVDTTNWGRVPNIQSVVNAFDNNENSRKFQDVGLDGLSDADERTFFKSYLDKILGAYGNTSAAYTLAANDPSSDNYHYFRGSDYDNTQLGILDRYKKYNGLEGNSPVGDNEGFQSSASTMPDVEDINRDNTLSENESYFQYKVDIKPGRMNVGENFISDKIEYTATLANEQQSKVTWYQFKVPITEWERKIGDIQDFKSIRFVRMFLRGFSKPVIVRFAKLDLVRGEWRKYTYSFMEAGENIAAELPGAQFEISAVNIEENGKRLPINYVLPPGITRVIDPSNPQLRQLNEQSIVLRVAELQDGDAKAGYKNVTMDIRKYKRLKMDVHAEKFNNQPLADNDLSVFIRLGTDYKDNFYEYEVPLKLTPPGSYNNDADEDRRIVWPDLNQIDIPLEIFQKVKQERNDQMRIAGSVVTPNTLFKSPYGRCFVKVKGYPNLSNVRTIMIGVRNPKKTGSGSSDDGLEKSGEIWCDELRLTDFDEEGGWAAIGRVQAKLADLGNVTLSGMTVRPGFGSIEKKVSERSKETLYQYDLSSNFQLGKFFPEKAGINIPMYIGLSETFKNPEYNPLEPDVLFEDALSNPNLREGYKDTIVKFGQDHTKRKSLNFTNVKINKAGGKSHFYDISNWAVSYAYTETNSSNITTEFFNQKSHSGSIAYTFSTTPKSITPFKSAGFMKSPAWKIIKDFQLNLTPSQIAFRTNLNKDYDERRMRNVNEIERLAMNQTSSYKLPITTNKNFMWVRQYDLKHDITPALKFDFAATNTSRVDEPDGRITNERLQNGYRDTVLNRMAELGRTTQYHHTANLSYDVPLNKIPLFNWVTANARYSANYDWNAGPRLANDTLKLGNTIKNGNTMQGNVQLNLLTLYNKIKFFKDVNQKFSKPGGKKPDQKKTEKVNYDSESGNMMKDIPKTIKHNLKTEDIVVKFYDSANVEIKGDIKIINENKIQFTPKASARKTKVKITGTREIQVSIIRTIAEYTSRFLMSVKNVSVQYSQNNGTILPGYLPNTKYFGTENYIPDANIFQTSLGSFANAPGIPFIVGWQDTAFARESAERYMITPSELMTSPFVMTHTSTLNARASVEPIPDLRIDLNANHNYGQNRNVLFTNRLNEGYKPINTQITGNFSMSIVTISSAFGDAVGNDADYGSKAFNNLLSARQSISKRLAQQRNNVYGYNNGSQSSDGFYDGFSRNSQNVLIPAFIAAYTGQSAENISLSDYSFQKSFPSYFSVRPNWSANYNGLNKIEFVKRYIKTATLTHTYRSTFNIGNYISNPRYDPTQEFDNGFNYVRYELNNDIVPKYDISTVSISEQFSPIIGLDLTWNNSLMTKFEIKKTRNLSLSFSNNQLNEMQSDEYVIGGGYRIKDVIVSMRAGGKQRTFKSDINLRADFSVRRSLTLIRKIEEEVTQPTSGQTSIALKTTADYVLSDKFVLQVFFDQTIITPIVSTTFKNSTTKFGVSVRFQFTGQ